MGELKFVLKFGEISNSITHIMALVVAYLAFILASLQFVDIVREPLVIRIQYGKCLHRGFVNQTNRLFSISK